MITDFEYEEFDPDNETHRKLIPEMEKQMAETKAFWDKHPNFSSLPSYSWIGEYPPAPERDEDDDDDHAPDY